MTRQDRGWDLQGNGYEHTWDAALRHGRFGMWLLVVAGAFACTPAERSAPPDAVEPKPVAAQADAPLAAPGCDSGVRDGFADPKRFPRIAACAGSWDEPGLVGGGLTGESTAGALCSKGWHICTSIAEVERKSGGQGCAGAGLSEGTFFAILEGATKPPKCFTRGSVGVLGCGSLGAPAPAACAPVDRVTNPGCSALGAPWSCEKNSELWSLVKSQHAGGGVLCCEGAAPGQTTTTRPWGFGGGIPFTGSGETPCGEITITTTNTEPWGDGAFRNVPGGEPAVVVLSFSQPVSAFRLSARLSGAEAYLRGFGVRPSHVAGGAKFDGEEVRTPKGADKSTALLSWFGLHVDALALVIGGRDRGTVTIEGYGIGCASPGKPPAATPR